ncbi:carbon-nitrogen hydrolase family protein [Candidatus Binatia bacterium]|nr:carbon-nitrogen hydrolase family protein [Candidatus Binatia bacterium]
MRRYVVAAVQLDAGADRGANLERAERFVVEAAQRGARLVVLPEVFSWRGPAAREAEHAETIPGPTTAWACRLAGRLRIHLAAGSLLEANPAGRPFNTSVLVGPEGAIAGCYRKIHLFDVDLPGRVSVRESDTRQGGDHPVTVPTELGAIGMSVCYDLRFPELYRRLSRAGAEIVLVPSAFTFPTGAAHWEVLVRARAIENQVYVIAPDQTGQSASGGLNYGHSMIVDPWGVVVARATDGEGLVLADVDRDYVERVRRELPCLAHAKLLP